MEAHPLWRTIRPSFVNICISPSFHNASFSTNSPMNFLGHWSIWGMSSPMDSRPLWAPFRRVSSSPSTATTIGRDRWVKEWVQTWCSMVQHGLILAYMAYIFILYLLMAYWMIWRWWLCPGCFLLDHHGHTMAIPWLVTRISHGPVEGH